MAGTVELLDGVLPSNRWGLEPVTLGHAHKPNDLSLLGYTALSHLPLFL